MEGVAEEADVGMLGGHVTQRSTCESRCFMDVLLVCVELCVPLFVDGFFCVVCVSLSLSLCLSLSLSLSAVCFVCCCVC